ncbi:50S ribosomal protein L2 [bacterium]|nr:50S ribosomal protein L2 [bacterium]
MAIKSFRPYTPPRRTMTVTDYSVLSGDKPEKSLLRPKSNNGGRNNLGRCTAKGRGGGNRQHYRIIDFRRRRDGESALVKSLQYDPNRSAFIALIQYPDGKLNYIIAPDGLQVGQYVSSGPDSEIRAGNTLPLSKIPDGTQIHNIELIPGQRGKLVRAAGTWAQLMAKEGKNAVIRLPSGEMRRVSADCRATIGRVSNTDHENVSLGKAGRTRHLGHRPTVRGMHKNPVDHPMGGGEAKGKGGKQGMSATGVLAKGFRTRRKSKARTYLVKDRRGK